MTNSKVYPIDIAHIAKFADAKDIDILRAMMDGDGITWSHEKGHNSEYKILNIESIQNKDDKSDFICIYYQLLRQIEQNIKDYKKGYKKAQRDDNVCRYESENYFPEYKAISIWYEIRRFVRSHFNE